MNLYLYLSGAQTFLAGDAVTLDHDVTGSPKPTLRCIKFAIYQQPSTKLVAKELT